jgi:hypothetical protein
MNGDQVSTWEYHDDDTKTDPICGSKTDAFGDQSIAFGSSGDGRLVIGRPARGKPIMVLTNKQQTGPWAIQALADRNGTWNVTMPPPDDRCDVNGGGAPPQRDKECGRRGGLLLPRVEARGRGSLKLMAESSSWGAEPPGPNDPPTGKTLDELYTDCPFWTAGRSRYEGESGLLPSVEKLPMDAMLNSSKKKFTLHFGRVRNYRTAEFTGRTVVAFKLRLTRTTLTPAG